MLTSYGSAQMFGHCEELRPSPLLTPQLLERDRMRH